MGWHLTITSQGVVLFTASTRSRQEIEALAAEARRLRPNVEIFIRPPDGTAHHAATPRSDPRQLELDLEPEPAAMISQVSADEGPPMTLGATPAIRASRARAGDGGSGEELPPRTG